MHDTSTYDTKWQNRVNLYGAMLEPVRRFLTQVAPHLIVSRGSGWGWQHFSVDCLVYDFAFRKTVKSQYKKVSPRQIKQRLQLMLEHDGLPSSQQATAFAFRTLCLNIEAIRITDWPHDDRPLRYGELFTELQVYVPIPRLICALPGHQHLGCPGGTQ